MTAARAERVSSGGGATIAPDPAPHKLSDRSDLLAEARLTATITQWRSLVVAQLGLTLVVSALAWTQVSHVAILGWFAATLAFIVVRSRMLPGLLRLHPREGLRRIPHFSFVNGLIASTPAWAFMPSLDLAGKSLITMLMVAQVTTSLAASAFYLPAHRIYSALLLLPLLSAWLIEGAKKILEAGRFEVGAFEFCLAALIVLLLSAINRFGKRYERTFIESFEIRFENAELVKSLRDERAALALERDRAEEANRAKSRFLAAASHDLRQPIHALSLLAGALSLRPLEGRTRDISVEIERAVEDLGSEFDALLDISRLDAGVVQYRPRAVAVAETLDAIAREQRSGVEKKGIALVWRCDPTLAAWTDPVLLAQMLRNLVDNAVKYTERGRVAIQATETSSGLLIDVTDTGIGIPASEHERVFEEYYQLGNPERDKSRGFGIGLAIVRRLAALMQVEISLDSAPGRGTTVRLRLQRANAVPVETPASKTGAAHTGWRVLVIDDEGGVRRSMRLALEEIGCEVDTAEGLEDALKLAADARPDIILADFRLRAGLSGIDAVARVRELWPQLPALLISGDTDPSRLREAHDAGFTLLHKPVPVAALRDAMAALLPSSGAVQVGERTCS